MLKEKRMILVGAAGRNLGKTHLIVQLIRKYKDQGRTVAAVKVVTIHESHSKCPRGEDSCGMCEGLQECFEIREEKNPGKKDTMIFLEAGADRVFLIRCRPKGLEEAMRAFLEMVPNEDVIICESNSVRTVLEPEKFLMLHRPDGPIKPSAAAVLPLADVLIERKDNAQQ